MSRFSRFYRPPSAATGQEVFEAEVHGAYKKKIDPSYMDQEGRGPLHLLLLMEGDRALHVVEHVIRVGGCSVHGADRHGTRPLMYAARQGAVRCLKLLLGHGAKLDEQSNDGDTALMLAAANRQSEAIELLLRAGAAVNLTNNQGENALHHAVSAGCEVCVRALLKYGSRMNHQDTEGQTPLHVAAQASDAEMLRTLLTAYGHSKAQLNLQDSQGRTALHWTCTEHSTNPACLSLLLEHGPDTSIFDHRYNSPVILAIKSNKVEQLRTLLSVLARRMTKDGRSPVALAATLGYTQCVRLLLDSNLNPNLCGIYRQTPLICAAFESHLDIFDLLLSRGANQSALTNTSALFAALSCINDTNVRVRHTIIAKLLSTGADMNVKFVRSWYRSPLTGCVVSPLSIAFDSGYVSIVRMLLTAGLSVTHPEVQLFINDQSQDTFERNDLIKPIQDLLSEPQSLSHQIRLSLRKHIRLCNANQMRLSERIQSLPIAPRLISFLLLDELYDEEPELVRRGPSSGRPREESYHPFRGCSNAGILDLMTDDSDGLEGTLLYETLLRFN